MAFRDRQKQVRRKNFRACALVHSLDIVGETWRVNVLRALERGEMRFNELKRATHARARTLSQVLDKLVEHGLVQRRMERDAPVAVYYSLTEKGQALEPVFEELERWADEWLEDGHAQG